jgi:head-tail adaptor
VSLIGPRTSIGRRQLRIELSIPGPTIPDGDGGYTQAPVPLDPPAVYGAVRPATAADLERITAGTVIAQASYAVSIPFHPGVNTQTELRVEDPPRPPRRFAVVAVVNPDMRGSDLDLVCSEVVR